MSLKLYKHQQDFLKTSPKKSALVWSCGTGKTITALLWAQQHGGQTVVVSPKPLKQNWSENVITHMMSDNVYAVTKEEFRRDVKDLPHMDNIIVDEVHLGFLTPNFKSAMSKALRWYIKTHNPNVLLLSATVYSSSPWNIYSLATYLGKNWNYNQFNNEFFNHIWMGNRIIPQAKKDAPERLAKLTKTFTSVVHIDDCMDVPIQLHAEPEYFALTTAQTKAIKDYYDPLPIVRFTKQHQIEQGIMAEDEVIFSCDKVSRLVDIINENKKIAIICRYNYQIERLVDMLPEDRKRYVFNGYTKDRHALTKEVNTLDHAIVFIQSETAEGYELPTFPVCVFMSMSYSYVKYEQMLGRFLRMNNPSKTTFMYLLTAGTSVDKAVYHSVLDKKNFDLELYAQRS